MRGDGHMQAVASKAVHNHIQTVDESEIRHARNKCWTVLHYRRSGSSGDCSFITNGSATTSSQTWILSGRPGRMGIHLDVGINGAYRGQRLNRKGYCQSIMCCSHWRILHEGAVPKYMIHSLHLLMQKRYWYTDWLIPQNNHLYKPLPRLTSGTDGDTTYSTGSKWNVPSTGWVSHYHLWLLSNNWEGRSLPTTPHTKQV